MKIEFEVNDINIIKNESKEIINKLLKICMYLDENAATIYNCFAKNCKSDDLAITLREMALEESEHVSYWIRAKKIIDSKPIFDIFDSLYESLITLTEYQDDVKEILKNYEGITDELKIIEVVIRFENYFLHGFFIKLLNVLERFEEGMQIKETYLEHINKLISVVRRNSQFSNYEMAVGAFHNIWEYALKLENLNFEKNKMIGFVAHDLLNPITSIKGFSELLDLKLSTANPSESIYISRIIEQCDFMISLISETLDVSSIESGYINLNITNTNIHNLLEKLICVMRLSATKRDISIIYNSSFEERNINIDPMKIEQIISNLISNSIKYSPNNTNIIIETNWTNDDLIISVQDFGIGIPSSEQHKLFTPFGKTSVQTFDNQKSTGLGLSIVRKLMSAHGGDVSFQSIHNKGSVFYVKLPTNN